MTESQDFVDLVAPLLAAGTWTNYGSTPKIVSKNKANLRGNKNARIEVRNEEGGYYDLTFDSSEICQHLRGTISIFSTLGSDRNKMKKDVMAIMKSSGYPFTAPNQSNNPKIRNKEATSLTFEIIAS